MAATGVERDAMSDRAALVIPGRMFGPNIGMLMFAAMAAERRDALVDRMSWQRTEELDPLPSDGWLPWTEAQIRPHLDAIAAARPLLIGKSLGTFAARLAADRGLPAIWLTPVLTTEAVATPMREATAPLLLIGGTADRLWDGALARELSPYVLEVDGADHGLCLPGPMARSAEVLGQVTTAVEDFLDTVVWPAR